MRLLLLSVSILLLAACSFEREDDNADRVATDADRSANSTTENLADSMASNDAEDSTVETSLDIDDSQERPIMQAQVVLDRQGFGPGVIDGKMGMSTENALRGFQEANSLDITGEMDGETEKKLAQWSNIPATRVVRIPKEWGEIEFASIPDDAAEQAKMEQLGYTSLDEKLAERFHTTTDVLKMLNPGGQPATNSSSAPKPSPSKSPASSDAAEQSDSLFAIGQMIRVPNIGADRIAPDAVIEESWQQTLKSLGVGTEQPSVAKVVVSEKAGTLKGFDAAGKLVALFTVTTGSSNDPLLIGDWKINGVGHNPPFAYNPELFWDVPDDKEKQQLPPGPNGPVGVVWIDLSKEHYGIHGTPEPQTIGRVQSHGCVRLTNWDAARLAEMVSTSTSVVFEA